MCLEYKCEIYACVWNINVFIRVCSEYKCK